jgi:hypothetical protein
VLARRAVVNAVRPSRPRAAASPSATGNPGFASPSPSTSLPSDHAVSLTFKPTRRPRSAVFATGAGDGRHLFVVEQPGRIRIVRDGRLLEHSSTSPAVSPAAASAACSAWHSRRNLAVLRRLHRP